jgi:hypothetical protein
VFLSNLVTCCKSFFSFDYCTKFNFANIQNLHQIQNIKLKKLHQIVIIGCLDLVALVVLVR